MLDWKAVEVCSKMFPDVECSSGPYIPHILAASVVMCYERTVVDMLLVILRKTLSLWCQVLPLPVSAQGRARDSSNLILLNVTIVR